MEIDRENLGLILLPVLIGSLFFLLINPNTAWNWGFHNLAWKIFFIVFAIVDAFVIVFLFMRCMPSAFVYLHLPRKIAVAFVDLFIRAGDKTLSPFAFFSLWGGIAGMFLYKLFICTILGTIMGCLCASAFLYQMIEDKSYSQTFTSLIVVVLELCLIVICAFTGNAKWYAYFLIPILGAGLSYLCNIFTPDLSVLTEDIAQKVQGIKRILIGQEVNEIKLENERNRQKESEELDNIAVTMSKNTCPQCGAVVDSGKNFCKKCGAKLH